MGIIIAQRDRRLLNLLALQVFEKTFSCVFLSSYVLLVILANLFDSIDRYHIFVIDSHALEHFQVELQFGVLLNPFHVLFLLLFLLSWILEGYYVKIEYGFSVFHFKFFLF